ncbi:MAG: response regulator [Methanomicrobiales archaeon]|nr:response regulator [Methanomicrobiales archaeon]
MGKKKILVVEDEFITASDIQSTLNGMGFDVPGLADTGEDAVKMAGELKPDAILMDISLKGKMNGITAAGIIKDRYGIPVIYLTGQSDDATINRALESEPFGYIIKPFEEKTLKVTIGMALYKHAIDESLRESDQLVHSLIDSNTEPMFILDQNTRVLVINEALASGAPGASKTAGDQTLDSLASGGLITKKLADAVRTHFFDKKTFVFDEEFDGKWVAHSITPLVDTHGQVVRCAVHSSDVTEIKQADRKLKALNEQLLRERKDLVIYKAMLDSMDDILIATTDTGAIFFVNDAFRKRFGYTLDEVKGKQIGMLKDPQDTFPIDSNAFFVDKKTVWNGSLTVVTKHQLKLKTLLKSTPVIRNNITICRVFVLRERLA